MVMNWDFSHDVLIAFVALFAKVAVEKVFLEPLAIVWGRRASVELLARAYEVLDHVMGDLMRTYSGEELRNEIRNRLEKATGTKWTNPMIDQVVKEFNPEKAAERIANNVR